MLEIGQIFYHHSKGDLYILAQVDANEVSLISLREGNRWAAPVDVADIENITETEWQKISIGGRFDRQKQLERLFKTT